MGEGLFDEFERRRHATAPDDADPDQPDAVVERDPDDASQDDPSEDGDDLSAGDLPADDLPAGDRDRPMRVLIEPVVSEAGAEARTSQTSSSATFRTAPAGDRASGLALAMEGTGMASPFDTAIRRWDHTAAIVDGTQRPAPLEERATVEVADDAERPARPPWWEWPVMVVMALLLAFLLRTFVVQIFWIPSGSMEDTLQINDRIAIEKVTTRFGGVDRGDVVVFASHEPLPMPDGTVARLGTRVGQFLGVVPIDAQDFVKRIIGLPGDSIVISDGIVSVNGVQLDEDDYAQLDSANGNWDVPAGKLFVMGDNRAHSNDSRAGLGFIDQDDVLGRAVLKIWPFDRFGSVEGVNWDEIPDPN